MGTLRDRSMRDPSCENLRASKPMQSSEGATSELGKPRRSPKTTDSTAGLSQGVGPVPFSTSRKYFVYRQRWDICCPEQERVSWERRSVRTRSRKRLAGPPSKGHGNYLSCLRLLPAACFSAFCTRSSIAVRIDTREPGSRSAAQQTLLPGRFKSNGANRAVAPVPAVS